MADTEITAPKAEIPAAKTEIPAAKKIEKAAEKVTAQVTETVKATTEKATANLKDVQENVTTGLKRAAELARGYVDVQRTAVETVIKAGQIYGEGLQSLATHAANVNRVQFEDTIAHLRALTSVKSVKEAIELQAKFARATASRVLCEGSVLAEDYLKVAGQALTPVVTRAREAAEKVKSAA
jgi:phasin family protein